MVLSASMVWEPAVKVSDNTNRKRAFATHHCAATGTTHLFWEEIDSLEDWHLFYRSKQFDGSLSPPVQLSRRPLPFSQNQLSVQSADNGTRLLLAYGGYRRISNKGCTLRNDASCIEIYFAESLNGGANWTVPVTTNRTNQYDTIHRTTPSLVLEKDTGRVHIAYFTNQDNAIVTREPGSATFGLEKRMGYTFGASASLGFTREADNSSRYLHFVWHSNTADRTREVSYMKSVDNGKEWSRHRLIVPRYRSEVMHKVAINCEAAEKRIYVQYENKGVYYMLWSGDHGVTWEKPFELGRRLSKQHAIAMCGRDGKGFVFTTSGGLGMLGGRLQYFPTDSNKLEKLGFPLNAHAIDSMEAHCEINNQGKVTLSIAIRNDNNGVVFMTRGTMH